MQKSRKQFMVLTMSSVMGMLVSGIMISALMLGGCSKKGATSSSQPQTLIMLCGDSFTKPTEKLCQEFTKQTGIKIEITSAGSENFLPLIKAGREGDLLVTHDPYLQYTKDAHALAENVDVGYVAPVLVVQKGNPKHIKSIEDLARPGLKVALSNPKYSTCGEMVFKLLEKKGIKKAVLKNVGNRLTKGHFNLGNLIKTQAIDAAIMWNGVAHTFRNSLQIVKTPYEYDVLRRVHVMSLSYSKKPELQKKFMAFIRKNGPRVFAEYGYVK